MTTIEEEAKKKKNQMPDMPKLSNLTDSASGFYSNPNAKSIADIGKNVLNTIGFTGGPTTSPIDNPMSASPMNTKLKDISPITKKEIVTGDNTQLKNLNQISSPSKETNNWLRDESTGKVYTINAAGSINGGPVTNQNKGLMGGYNPDGTRILPSGNQGDQTALANSAPTWADEHKQFLRRSIAGDFGGGHPVQNQGLRLLTRDSNPEMGWKERKAYNEQILNNNQSDINSQRNFISNAQVATNQQEKNRIDAMNAQSESNLRDIQGKVLQAPPLKLSEYKPMVIKEPDGFGGTQERVVVPNASGQYVNGMAPKELSNDHPALKLLKDNMSNPLYLKKFKETYGYLPSWAETK